ncbi:MAG: hypothetical protein ABIB47_01575 [Candidatus Woesearchaeota archaeon]
MKKRLRKLSRAISCPNRTFDWEEEGYGSASIIQALNHRFEGELDNVRLYRDNGKNKWIFLGDFHHQPLILGVGRYSSQEHYQREYSLLKALNRAVPQFFPCVLGHYIINPFKIGGFEGEPKKGVISVSFVECLTHMDTALEFRVKREGKQNYEDALRTLAKHEGYAAGFVLGRTELVMTDPHPTNTLVRRVSSKELIIKFIDAERAMSYRSLKESLQILVEEYTRESRVRVAVIRHKDLFVEGVEQGLEDSKREVLK